VELQETGWNYNRQRLDPAGELPRVFGKLAFVCEFDLKYKKLRQGKNLCSFFICGRRGERLTTVALRIEEVIAEHFFRRRRNGLHPKKDARGFRFPP
jgi:hypothetical protein